MKSVKVFPEKHKYVYQSGVVFGGICFKIIFVNRILNIFLFLATLINLAATMAFAWASPGLPKLLEPGGPFLITVNQGTAIVSAMKVALVVVPIPAAWMMDRYFDNNDVSKLFKTMRRYTIEDSDVRELYLSEQFHFFADG